MTDHTPAELTQAALTEAKINGEKTIVDIATDLLEKQIAHKQALEEFERANNNLSQARAALSVAQETLDKVLAAERQKAPSWTAWEREIAAKQETLRERLREVERVTTKR